MNGIFGMLQLMLDTPLTDQQADYTRQAMTSCRRLTDLLANILEMPSIEAGNLRCERGPFDLRDSMGFVKELFMLSARQKN